MEQPTKELLTAAEVQEITGLSRPTIHRLRHAGVFPEPIRVGLRAVRWTRAALDSFLMERAGVPEASRKPAA